MFAAFTQAQDKVRGKEGNLKRKEKSNRVRIGAVIWIQDLFCLLPQMPINSSLNKGCYITHFSRVPHGKQYTLPVHSLYKSIFLHTSNYLPKKVKFSLKKPEQKKKIILLYLNLLS